MNTIKTKYIKRLICALQDGVPYGVLVSKHYIAPKIITFTPKIGTEWKGIFSYLQISQFPEHILINVAARWHTSPFLEIKISTKTKSIKHNKTYDQVEPLPYNIHLHRNLI
jgi:hypothetical protein